MSENRFFFCAELDPSLEPSLHRIELSLKWSLLFSQQLALSDVQLLYNPPFHKIVRDPKFEQLLDSTDAKGRPHIVASVRYPQIHEIIAEQIDAKHGGRHALVFSFVNKSQFKLIESLRKKGKLTLGKFYDIALAYREHADELQRLFIDRGIYRTSGRTPAEYARHVRTAVDDVLQFSRSPRIRDFAKHLRSMVFQGGEFREVYRRDLWRYVENSPLNELESEFIKKWVLILPYNRNIAASESFDMFYSGNLTQHALEAVIGRLPEYRSREWELDARVLHDLGAMTELGRLDFAQIARIRVQPEFEQTLCAFDSALCFGKADDAKRALQAHVKFLDRAIGSQIGEGPKVPVEVSLLFRAVQKGAEYKYPIAQFLPIGEILPLFTRMTDRMALLVTSPRKRALQWVGESIIEIAFSKARRGEP